MARARQIPKLPTLIDRGIGLLEVILPHGVREDPISSLPEGQRDHGGFWYPAGYRHPGDIFTPAQRKLQAKQRQVQRHRHKGYPVPPPMVSGSEGTHAADTAPARPHAPPLEAPVFDRTLPLPALSSDAPDTVPPARPAPAIRRTPAGPPSVRVTLPAPETPRRAFAAGRIVDSPEGSD